MAGTKKQSARAAAILTTSEVAATRIQMGVTHENEVTLDLSFTLGSLTNCIVRFYASEDGTTYKSVSDIGGAISYTLTADTERAFTFKLPGWSFFRATSQGTGTVTGSSATLLYRYNQKGSQF